MDHYEVLISIYAISIFPDVSSCFESNLSRFRSISVGSIVNQSTSVVRLSGLQCLFVVGLSHTLGHL
jgi:hypothetical protein